MRVVVCGGRDYQLDFNVHDFMAMLDKWSASLGSEIKVATGGCLTGADAIAKRWCRDNGIHYSDYPADWNNTIPRAAAGPIRNSHMLKDFKPDIVLAFPGGSGTADCVKKAQAIGITVILAGRDVPL